MTNKEDGLFVKLYIDSFRSGLVAEMGSDLWSVLAALATYMDVKGECFPAQDKLARQLGISRPTVNKRISQLVDFRFNGLPVIEKRYISPHETGGWKRCKYVILPESGLSIFEMNSKSKLTRIQRMKSMPYQNYLKTAHWKRVRKDAIIRAEGRCQLCNSSKELQVHHRTYERRGEELATDLTVLCINCHQKFHDTKE